MKEYKCCCDKKGSEEVCTSCFPSYIGKHESLEEIRVLCEEDRVIMERAIIWHLKDNEQYHELDDKDRWDKRIYFGSNGTC